MRKAEATYISLALILGLLSSTAIAAQQFEVFDPAPDIEGVFVYTGTGVLNGWEFRGYSENLHLRLAVYAVDTPESLKRAAEVELGIPTN